MNKTPIKMTLTVCTALTLLSLGGLTVSANDQPTVVPASEDSTIVDHSQQETVNRQITVISPENGEETVINQVANRVVKDEGDHSNVWPEYFPPVYEGYRPSEYTIPPKIVKENTKAEKVKITYAPLKVDDLQSISVAFVLEDIDGDKADQLKLVKSDNNGYVNFPPLDEGWEYVNKASLPEKIRYYVQGNGHSIHLLIQKQNNQSKQPEEPTEKPVTKQVIRKIILHLPAGDKVVTQTITANKEGDQWTIPAFEAYTVPLIDGYEASLNEVPTLQPTKDELAKEYSVEVNYAPLKNNEDEESTAGDSGESEDQNKEENKPANKPDDEEKDNQNETTPEEQPSKDSSGGEELNKPDKSDEEEPETGTTDQSNSDTGDKTDEEVVVPPTSENSGNNVEDQVTLPDKEEVPEKNDSLVDEKETTDKQEDIVVKPDQEKGNDQPLLPQVPTDMPKPEIVIDNQDKEESIPELGNKLRQIQAPLALLNAEDGQKTPSQLPQTGNHTSWLTILTGAVMTAWAALTSLLIFKRKAN